MSDYCKNISVLKKKLNEKKPVAKSKKKLYDFDKFEITTNYLA